MRTLDVFYLVAVWFFVLSLVSKSDRLYATILFLFSAFNILIFDFFDFTSGFNYLDKKELLIKMDGALALAITMVMIKENKAIKQAIIVCFMILCHSMILLNLITGSIVAWYISMPFYALYDELIIMLALLQIWVTRNGMAQGLNNSLGHIQGVLLRLYFYSGRSYKGLSSNKKRKVGS